MQILPGYRLCLDHRHVAYVHSYIHWVSFYLLKPYFLSSILLTTDIPIKREFHRLHLHRKCGKLSHSCSYFFFDYATEKLPLAPPCDQAIIFGCMTFVLANESPKDVLVRFVCPNWVTGGRNNFWVGLMKTNYDHSGISIVASLGSHVMPHWLTHTLLTIIRA